MKIKKHVGYVRRNTSSQRFQYQWHVEVSPLTLHFIAMLHCPQSPEAQPGNNKHGCPQCSIQVVSFFMQKKKKLHERS
jgi:hypothetical protein